MSQTFTPPQFGSFGKAVKDQFKKKYDFDSSFKKVHKSGDLTLESGLVCVKSGEGFNSRGFVKASTAKPKCKSWKCVGYDVELHTDVAQESKISLKKVCPLSGSDLTLTYSSSDSDIKTSKNVTSLAGELVKGHLAFSNTLKTDFSAFKGKHTVAAGFENFSVGASVAWDSSPAKTFAVSDYNGGVEYVKNSLIVSAFTETRAEKLNLAAQYKRDNFIYAGLVKTDLNLKAPQVTVGIENNLSSQLSYKLKAEFPGALVSAAVEHRLTNPSLSVGASAQFNLPTSAFQPLGANKFGVNVTMGDY